MRTQVIVAGGVAVLAGLLWVPACSSSDADDSPGCGNGRQDGTETGIDCGGSCPIGCDVSQNTPDGGLPDAGTGDPVDSGPPPRSDDGIENGTETDVDCGGANAPKCALGKSCEADSDCAVACSYAKKCIDTASCKPHLGGDTCGAGEVGAANAAHESCCKTLPVAGFTDPAHPGKQVYLDKYEITAGRVRAFIADITSKQGGKPNIRGWVTSNTPPIWDPAWTKFLPADREGDTVVVPGRLLGDPRGGVDVPPVLETDQLRNTGLDYQFNGHLFVYLHGNNCSTHAPTAFGFPTFFYPPDVLPKTGPQIFPPRADGTDAAGKVVPASEHLDVKSMSCISNALLAAFCHWDGGQLATDDVLDFVTATPSSLGNRAGCGTQVSENPPTNDHSMKGGRCADLALINATFDAGGQLPIVDSPLNRQNYEFPYFPVGTTHDKAWQVAAPGRGSAAAGGNPIDVVRIKPGDEPWMDLHGNLNETVLTMNGATFSGKFGLKYRGIGYQSARSELNTNDDWEGEGGVRRLERPEARAGFAGGRCMRFK